jgi:hypothetical protein
MVLYTCFKKLKTDYYICQRGILDTNEEAFEESLSDYKIISVPSSNLTYDILKVIDEIHMVKISLKEKIIFSF